MDGGRPTLAAQLKTLKTDTDKQSARDAVRGRPSARNTRGSNARRRSPRTSGAKLEPVDNKTAAAKARGRRRSGAEESKARGRSRAAAKAPANPRPPSTTRGGKASRPNGRGNGRASRPAPAKKVGPREVAERLVQELEKLLLWNREAGLPKDEASRILKEATKLVEEMQMMRERVDKGVSYNPSYAEKQFRKIIKPCREVLRQARDSLAARAYTMTHRARNKLTKLVAHDEAAGSPDDDAAGLIQAAEAAVAFAEEMEKKKDAAEDDDDEVTDAFIKAAHDAKLAVDAVGLAMRRRMKHELEAAEDQLHKARDRVDHLVTRNDAVGAPEGEATDAVLAAKAAVEKAEAAFETMDDNPDTLEFVTEFITSADAAASACDNAEGLLSAREAADYDNAIAGTDALEAQLERLIALHGKHHAYRRRTAPPPVVPKRPAKKPGKMRRQASRKAGGLAPSPEPEPARPGTEEDKAADRTLGAAKAAMKELVEARSMAKAAQGGDDAQERVAEFLAAAAATRAAVGDCGTAIAAAVVFDCDHGKEAMDSKVTPAMESLKGRAAGAWTGDGDSKGAEWKDEFDTAVAEYEDVCQLRDAMLSARGDGEFKSGDDGLAFCDATFAFTDRLDGWHHHLQQADAALSAFDEDTADTMKTQLLSLVTELQEALVLADALGLPEDCEERRMLAAAKTAVQECDDLAARLEEGGVTPEEAARFAKAVQRTKSVVEPAVAAVKRCQLTYYDEWVTVITTVTTEVEELSNDVDMNGTDTNQAVGALLAAGKACKAANAASDAVADDIKTRSEQAASSGGGGAEGGVTFLLDAGRMRDLRQKKDAAVAARKKATAALRQREHAQCERANDEFKQLRKSVKALKSRNAAWDSAKGATARACKDKCDGDLQQGLQQVEGFVDEVDGIKQLWTAFTTVYEDDDAPVAAVLQAGKQFREAVGAAHAHGIATSAAFEERDNLCGEECRTVYTTITTTIEEITEREEATKPFAEGPLMAISPDPDHPAPKEAPDATAARLQRAAQYSELAANARAKGGELEQALHALQTVPSDASAEERTALCLRAASACDAARDAADAAQAATARRQAALAERGLANAANAAAHLEALRRNHAATADADRVSDDGDEVVHAMQAVGADIAAAQEAAAALQAAQKAFDGSGSHEDGAAVAAALDDLNRALKSVPGGLAEVDKQLYERESALYSADKKQLAALREELEHLRHRQASAGSDGDDAGKALAEAEAAVAAAEAALAKVDGIDRADDTAAWRAALVELTEAVTGGGGAAGAIGAASKAADLRDASSTAGAQDLLDNSKTLFGHLKARNARYGREGDDGMQAEARAQRLVDECDELAAQLEAAKAGSDREKESELARAYMGKVQEAADAVKVGLRAAVKKREEGVIVDCMTDLGGVKTKLSAYHKRNDDDGEPDDEATALLAEADALYEAADKARDALRADPNSEEALDALTDAMKPLEAKMAELQTAFAAREDAGLARLTKDLEDVRGRIQAAAARNEDDGRPDDGATAEVDNATAALAEVDALLARLNAPGSEESKDQAKLKAAFVASVNNATKVTGKAEAALKRRSEAAKASARALLLHTTKRLQCLGARNKVAGEPDDDATEQLRQVTESHKSLQEMLSLGVVGGADDNGSPTRVGGLVRSVSDLTDAVEHVVMAVAARELEALDDCGDVSTQANLGIDKMKEKNMEWGSPDDDATKALAEAEAAEVALRELKTDLGSTSSHPALQRHLHRAMTRHSSQAMMGNGGSPFKQQHRNSRSSMVADDDEDHWVDAAKDVMKVIQATDTLKRAVEAAQAAFQRREEEGQGALSVDDAAKMLAELVEKAQQLEARNAADGSPNDHATTAVREAAAAVVAATTTQQLLAAAPNTKVIKDQFLTMVPNAADLIRQAEEELGRREATVQLEKVEQLGRGVVDTAANLDHLASQVASDEDASKEADVMDDELAAAFASARHAIAAAREAAAEVAAANEAVRAADPSDPAAYQAALARAEAARKAFDAANADAEAKTAAAHSALDAKRKGAASSLLADTAAAVAAAQAELDQLVAKNKADGEPDDDASKAIEVAQVAMFAVQGMRDRIEDDPANVGLHGQYADAVSNASDLIAAATTAMNARATKESGALKKAIALLAAAARQLEELNKVNREAGIPVDDATEAIDNAQRNLAAAQVLRKLVEHPTGVTANLVEQFKASAQQACESVDAAAALLQARGLRSMGGSSSSEVALGALKRLYDAETMYQKTYRIFAGDAVLKTLPVVVQIVNVATEDIQPARELRTYVFAACGNGSEHDAATKLQAHYRGHTARRRVDGIKQDTAAVEALTAEAADEARKAEMDAAAARLQALARGRAARRANENFATIKPLAPVLPLDKPVDDSVLSRVTQAQLAKVPTPTLIQFVDAVARAETAVNEAYRVITSQVQRQQVLHSAGADERGRAVELLRVATTALKDAQDGLAHVQADTRGSKPTTEGAQQIAAAGIAVQRAERAVARAQRGLDRYDEQVAPTVPDMVALVAATSEAKAVAEVAADAVEALGLGLQDARSQAEAGKRKAQVLAQAHSQLTDAARVLDECDRDLARLRQASASGGANDVEGMQAIQGAEQAVAAARLAHGEATDAYDRAAGVDPAQPAASAALDQCLVKAAKARVLSVAAARHAQAAKQHYKLTDGTAHIVTKQEGDAVARLELAKMRLEKYERQFRSMGNYAGNPDLLILHDMILVAKNELRAGHLNLVQFRSLQAKWEAGQEESKGSGSGSGNVSGAALQDSMNGLTLQVSKAVWAVDAVGRQLQLLSMSGYGAGGHHNRKWLATIREARQPFVDELNRGMGSKSQAVALVDGPTHGKALRYRGLYRTPDASRNNQALGLATSRRLLRGGLLGPQRWRLLARYRAKLYRVGRLHGDLLSLMQSRHMMVLPVSVGRRVQSAILNANRDLKVADKVVPSRKQRGQGPPTIAQLREFERVVRIARFKVYRFEYELQLALVVLEQRRQKGMTRKGTWRQSNRNLPRNGSGSSYHQESSRSGRRRRKHRRRRRDDDYDGESDYASSDAGDRSDYSAAHGAGNGGGGGGGYNGYSGGPGMHMGMQPGMPAAPGSVGGMSGMMGNPHMEAAAYGQQALNNYWQMQMEREYAAYKAQRSAQEAAMMGVGAAPAGYPGMAPPMSAGGMGYNGPAQLGSYYNNLQRGQSMYGMAGAGESMAAGGMHSAGSMYGGGMHPAGSMHHMAGAGSVYMQQQQQQQQQPQQQQPQQPGDAASQQAPTVNPLEGDFGTGGGQDDADMTALFAEARKTPPKRVRPHGSSRRDSKASRASRMSRTRVAARASNASGRGETLEVEYASRA